MSAVASCYSGPGSSKPWSADAERFALSGAEGDGSVAVLATASAREGEPVFERWTAMGLAHYESLGIAARAVRVRTRSDALDPSVVRQLDEVSMVFFSGGSPTYLARSLIGTPVWDGVLRLERHGFTAGQQFPIERIDPGSRSRPDDRDLYAIIAPRSDLALWRTARRGPQRFHGDNALGTLADRSFRGRAGSVLAGGTSACHAEAESSRPGLPVQYARSNPDGAATTRAEPPPGRVVRTPGASPGRAVHRQTADCRSW